MNDRQRQLTALLVTVIVSGLLLIGLLVFGLVKPVPPPPEYGVEINFGNSAVGMGDIQPRELSQAIQTQPSYTPEQSTNENVVTDNSDNISLNQKRQPQTQSKPQNVEDQKDLTKPQPPINPNALYNRRTTTSGGSEGITGEEGDQGDPRGTPEGQAYSGTQGSGGIAFSLNERESKSLIKPTYNSDEQGTVVVKIWVNTEGNVVRAQAGEKGTTTSDSGLWRAAEQAAMKSKFSSKADAPIQQVGQITYRFIKLN